MTAKVKDSIDFAQGRVVYHHLKARPELSKDELSIRADGDVITLEGYVKSRGEKSAAEKAALEVHGVRVVANDIEVRPAPERTDTEIAKEVLKRFEANILIPLDEVKAIIADGLVTLEGIVSSQFVKLLSEAAVKSVRGVTGIRNNLEVKPSALSSKLVEGPGI